MTDLISLSIPPVTPGSRKDDTNETTVEKVVEQLFTTTITDGVATLTGGLLSNLVDPTLDTDAATKNYIINNSPFVIGGPDTAVQLAQVWFMRTGPGSLGGGWNSISWSPSLSIFSATSIGSNFGTSSDGITWTSSSSTGISTPSAMDWSVDLSLFSIVGNGISTSSNGTSWTTRTNPIGTLSDVISSTSTNKFVAIEETATSTSVLTTTDGITWATRTTPTFAGGSTWDKISWDESTGFVAVGGSFESSPGIFSDTFMKSNDNGITWTTSGSGIFPTPPENSVASSYKMSVSWSSSLALYCVITTIPITNSSNIVTGTNAGTATSSDGITWTSLELTLPNSTSTTFEWTDLIWSTAKSIFVATGNELGIIATSSNGTDWIISSTPDTIKWEAITYSPSLGIFATISSDTVTDNVATSNLTDTSFTGFSDFTFDKTTNTLSVSAITDGTATLEAGNLTDILDPVSLQDAATKNYVDDNILVSKTTISSGTGVTYTASQMVNGIIERDGIVWSTSSAMTFDTTATAADIVSEFSDPRVNSTAYFSIYFETSTDSSLNGMSIVGGTGVTINPINPIIYANYVAIGRIMLDNVTGGSEAVTLHFDSISYFTDKNWSSVTSPTGWSYLVTEHGLQITEASVEDEFLTPMDPKALTDQDHLYTFEEISSNKLITRSSLVADSNDSFVDALSFISSSTALELGPAGPGGLEFCIQNIDPTFNIILTTATGWTLNATTEKLTIGPGQNGLFMVQVDTIANTCNLFSLGIFERNGP